ncbi:acyl-CoA dehydrogenase family protein [Aliiglaciecola lipolytica]|uniref:Acyl-CoA dehydrogenase domain-containing protein n=1 Tax=Aliiglaciecola lipolytica E3 TaxID=1127673 RepID=K6YRR0_9ALTE|nr:acyl-CoA dehydrogenase family protein [Aliiglaciecola lipolytica]GAC14005.1 acyl-CoA dehydrogenase domain-containing protein [Aliiglaciecola lipolytica E3]
MEFSFTDEQKMIQDTAQSFLAELSTSNAIRSAMNTEQGFDNDTWQKICSQMYWQATHIPEEYGGMGLGYVELAIMLEKMGQHLLCSPFLSTVCFGANALIVAGSEEQKQQYLSQICEYGLTATLAYTSSNGIWDAEAVQAVVKPQGDGYLLSGTYRYVLDGHTADTLIVAARSEKTQGDDGISLFIVEANTSGIKRTWLPTMDQTRKQAEIVFNEVELKATALMGEYQRAWPALKQIIDLATIAIAAEQVGGAQKVLDLSVEYTKERVQFGRSVASFQAVKHQAADMMMRTEVARSAIYYAACVAQEVLSNCVSLSELSEAASVAKAYCSDSYFKNAGDAIQLHGGVGFTWEYDVHLYFKRAKSSEVLLGNSAFHRERVAKLLLD